MHLPVRLSYRFSQPVFVALLTLFLSQTCGLPQGTPITKAQVEAQAQKAYREAHAKWQQNPENPELGWQFGRACFDWADLVDTNKKRAELAAEGIEACRRALRQNPKLGPAHYYLAMNLGQRARTDKLAALKIIHEMEREFLSAIAYAPKFDYAGAARCLGILYREAPGWPIGVGNHHKAVEQHKKAVELAPEYPDNWITLLETYLELGEKERARALLGTAEEKIQKARQTFAGRQWAWNWQSDWEPRWEKVKAKAAIHRLESPRTKDR